MESSLTRVLLVAFTIILSVVLLAHAQTDPTIDVTSHTIAPPPPSTTAGSGAVLPSLFGTAVVGLVTVLTRKLFA